MAEQILMTYTDKNKVDQGRLKEFVLDLAYGTDENSFELTMPINNDSGLKDDCYIYSESDGNIGGRIDSIKADSANKEVIYKGTTWHGILEQHVIVPPVGQDYFIANGDANSVLQTLITWCGLDGLFVASSETLGIDVYNYKIRYGSLYSVLKDMLKEINCKLMMSVAFIDNVFMIQLEAQPLIDYSQNEEWSSSNRDFVAEKTYNPINHMICLGSGNLHERHVIHLYSNGSTVNPYSQRYGIYYNDTVIENRIYRFYDSVDDFPTPSRDWQGINVALTDGTLYQCMRSGSNYYWDVLEDCYIVQLSPVQDSDYIFDERYKDFFGIDENTIVYDYPNTETKYNYIKTVDMLSPAEWSENYAKYFYYEDGNYKNYEGIKQTKYLELPTEPANWQTNPEEYYKLVDGEYVNVDKVDADIYTVLPSQPSDWGEPENKYGTYYKKVGDEYVNVEGVPTSYYDEANITDARNNWTNGGYKNYYTRYHDGTKYIYTQVKSVSRNIYVLQTSKPDNWATNYGDYYRLSDTGSGAYVKVTGVTKKKNKKKIVVAPTWHMHRYYTKATYQAVPGFNYSQGDLWIHVSKTEAPRFMTDYYYQKDVVPVAPTFVSGTYYNKVDVVIAPAYDYNAVYMQVVDHYANLVENALKRFQDYLNCDKISITLKPTEQYDIGDIVGAADEITGLSVWQPITKKIIKIQRNRKTIDYVVGNK